MDPSSPISPSRRKSSLLDPGSKQTNLSLQPYDPNDGYDYNNVGDPPEGSDTKFEVVITAPEHQDISLPSPASKLDVPELSERKKAKISPKSPAAQDLEPTSQELEEHVPGLEGPKNRIGRRPLMQWRAKVPSDLEQGNLVQEQIENGQLSENHANVSSNVTGSKYNLRKRSTTRRISNAGPQENKDKHLRVETHEIKLHWKKIPTDEETKFELNVTSVRGDGVAEDHLKWHHRKDLIMNLNKLKDIVSQCRSNGLPNEEIGLTERLLRRVKVDKERSFRGGYFLQPHANRYDGTHVLKDKPDVACIFFNFPYFSFSKALPKPDVKGEHHEHLEKEDMDPRKDHEHPVRTLLQSRYRLNKTTVRDQLQAPRSLERKALTSFISPLPEYWDCTSTKLVDEILYVPQLWGMILGTNTIITSGSLTSTDLQGPVLKLSPSDHRLSLVQIFFGDEARPFNYPVQQCLSWFGLANKLRRIVDKLGIEKAKANLRDYRFYRNSTPITINNWSQILRESRDIETLRIEMKRIEMKRIEMKRIAPGINVTHHADDTISSQTIPDTNNVPTDPVVLPLVDNLPEFNPFLEWPVLDQFGESYKEDEGQKGQGVRQFLAHVKRSLTLTEFDQNPGRPQMSTRQPSATTGAQIDRETFTQAGETLANLRVSQTITHFPKRERLFDRFKRLLEMFVREKFYTESDVISLYWGSVSVILKELESSESQAPNLSELTIAVSNLVAHTEELHRGVRHFQPMDVPDQSGINRDRVADDGVLLEVMIDALISIFKMVIAAARYVKRPKKQDSTGIAGPNSDVRKWYQEVEAKLKDAKDQLIVESEVQSRTESVGSVVTPETTMILFLKRLASGVYGNSCIDIVGVYEECFQQLVREVEYSASRRLLKRINGFQEEIDIINDVLKQQQKVLSDYRYRLDPASFKTASGHRKMRFPYEKKNIDKFIETLRERSSYCAELKERARELAVQNVQLVETLQDDSNKAILMFTIVAVIFLPLSFVSGYFGMNFPDLTSTKNHSSHFWKIAAPLTSGILILCVVISIKGEQIFFAIAGLFRWMKKLALGRGKEKAT